MAKKSETLFGELRKHKVKISQKLKNLIMEMRAVKVISTSNFHIMECINYELNC